MSAYSRILKDQIYMTPKQKLSAVTCYTKATKAWILSSSFSANKTSMFSRALCFDFVIYVPAQTIKHWNRPKMHQLFFFLFFSSKKLQMQIPGKDEITLLSGTHLNLNNIMFCANSRYVGKQDSFQKDWNDFKVSLINKSEMPIIWVLWQTKM